MAPPSRFYDGQPVVCIESCKFIGFPFAVEKGRLYKVFHACQFGPAVCLVGQENACFPDALFRAVELASDEMLEELLEEALSFTPQAIS